MTQRTKTESEPTDALRTIALRFPEAQEGVTCSRSAFKARNKAFLFMGTTDHSYDAMVKLGESLAEAARLAAKEPSHYKIGAHGWVTVTFSRDELPPPGLLERWIDESYRLIVPKQLVAMLPERASPAAGPTQTVKKRAAEKISRR